MDNEDTNVIGVESLFERAQRHIHGNKSRPNFDKAIQIFRICAQAGHLEAQYHLGMALKFIDEDGEELKEAIQWIKRAANRGHSDAQFALGCSYSIGEGVRRNRVIALRWFILAGSQGDEDADLQCALVADSLTQEQQKRSMAMALRWKLGAGMKRTIKELLETPGLLPNPEEPDDDDLPRFVRLSPPIPWDGA